MFLYWLKTLESRRIMTAHMRVEIYAKLVTGYLNFFLCGLHSSLSSGFPREVTERAVRNSSNSIVPSPFASNRLNTRLNRCYLSYITCNPVSFIDII